MLPILGHSNAEPAVQVGAGGPHGNRHIQHPALDSGQVDLPADWNIPMDHPLAPVFFQLTDRILVQPPVPDRQLPGQGHLSEPAAMTGLSVHCVPVLHPGDHDTPPIGSRQGLGGIEVQSVVDGLNILLGKVLRSVIFSDQANRAVARVELQPDGGHLIEGIFKQKIDK